MTSGYVKFLKVRSFHPPLLAGLDISVIENEVDGQAFLLLTNEHIK